MRSSSMSLKPSGGGFRFDAWRIAGIFLNFCWPLSSEQKVPKNNKNGFQCKRLRSLRVCDQGGSKISVWKWAGLLFWRPEGQPSCGVSRGSLFAVALALPARSARDLLPPTNCGLRIGKLGTSTLESGFCVWKSKAIDSPPCPLHRLNSRRRRRSVS